MSGMIAAVGVGILADSLKSHRDLLLIAASLGLSTAVNFAPLGPCVYRKPYPH
jgi:xanthine/uracil permease